MQITDLREFNKILDQLGMLFGKPPDDEIRRVYFEALKAYPLAAIRERATDHMAKGKFFPKPAELRPAYEKPEDGGKYPALFTEAWWSLRERTLREAFPRGLDQKSRDRLDHATFGADASPEQLRRAADCYARAWPGVDRTTYPESNR